MSPENNKILIVLFMLIFCGNINNSFAILCVQCSEDGSGTYIRNTTNSFNKTGNVDATFSCILAPPPPQSCDENMTSCLVIATYQTSREVNGYPINIVRTCSFRDLGWDCRLSHPSAEEENSPTIEVCHETCFKDGCNGGVALGVANYKINLLLTYIIIYLTSVHYSYCRNLMCPL